MYGGAVWTPFGLSYILAKWDKSSGKGQNQNYNMVDEDRLDSCCVDGLDVCESMGTLPPTEMAQTWQSQANQACCSAAWILVPSKLSRMKQPKGKNKDKPSALKLRIALKTNTVFCCMESLSYAMGPGKLESNNKRQAEGYISRCRSTASWPVPTGDALPTPDAGGWAGTFGCTFGMASMASIILICSCGKHTESSKHERQENNTKGNLLQKKTSTENYTAWCC